MQRDCAILYLRCQPKLNEVYERDLEKVQRLKPAQKTRAIAVLRWILFALRPLTVRELAEALAATIDDSAETYPRRTRGIVDMSMSNM